MQFTLLFLLKGCATILWRDPKKMLDAAKAMKLSSKDLLELKVIDEIIVEPLRWRP